MAPFAGSEVTQSLVNAGKNLAINPWGHWTVWDSKADAWGQSHIPVGEK